MQAIVFTLDGEMLAEVNDPHPAAGEVLLGVEFCGVCGSDLHAGTPDFQPGIVMGHEFSATVLEVGRDIHGISEGDRVVVNPNGETCGHCFSCLRGAWNMCEQVWNNSIGVARNGGLAPMVAVPASTVHALPDSVDFAAAALVEPLAVALRTVRRSGISVGDNAVVFGGGPIGLLVTAILRAAGAGQLTIVEPSPARRDLATRLGATTVLDPSATSIKEALASASPAPGFAFECSGVAELVGMAASILRPHGTLSITGYSRRPPTFNAADVLFKEITILGNFIYVDEFPTAIEMLASGAVDVTPLISGVVSIARASDAFALMRSSPEAVKYLVSDRHR